MAAPIVKFCLLPDNIILEILAYLPVKDRCIAGRVCKRWRRIVQDNSLWRHVDLSPYEMSLKKLWKIVRTHFSECLLTMKVRGFWNSKSTKWRMHSLSDAMLEELDQRCPNISSLTLVQCNTDNLHCKKLPKSLNRLTMTQCLWTPRWLRSLDDLDLTHLDLSGSTRVDNFDMSDIVEKFPNLASLALNGCYRVGESGVSKVATSLVKLRHLELSQTACSDLAVHHICRHLADLRHLNVSQCSLLTQSSLGDISAGLTCLESLDMSANSQLTLGGFMQLNACTSLRHLKLESTTTFNEEDVKSLQTSLGENVKISIVPVNP